MRRPWQSAGAARTSREQLPGRRRQEPLLDETIHAVSGKCFNERIEVIKLGICGAVCSTCSCCGNYFQLSLMQVLGAIDLCV